MVAAQADRLALVLFFLIMTGLTYAVKRKVWADVH